MRELRLLQQNHNRTKRNYLGRMLDNKIQCSKVSREYDMRYWDSDRKYGYGGYYDDGRWKGIAKALIELYGLDNNSKVLDIGCGKGFLLKEIKKILPDIIVKGIDRSEYAVKFAHPDIKQFVSIGKVEDGFSCQAKLYDLVLCINVLHNLHINEFHSAIKEIERLGKNKYVVMDSYHTLTELFNLQCWALTANSFFSTGEWCWLMENWGYTGDYEFTIFC